MRGKHTVRTDGLKHHGRILHRDIVHLAATRADPRVLALMLARLVWPELLEEKVQESLVLEACVAYKGENKTHFFPNRNYTM